MSLPVTLVTFKGHFSYLNLSRTNTLEITAYVTGVTRLLYVTISKLFALFCSLVSSFASCLSYPALPRTMTVLGVICDVVFIIGDAGED